MIFEWDEAKRREVAAKHKVDLLYAALIFEGAVFTAPDDREDFGEKRFRSVGLVDGDCFVVVYTQRDGAIRLITAWKGGRHERARYQASLARRHQEDEGTG